MCDGARLRHCARQDEIARLRGEVESEKKLKAVVQAQLTRLLQSAAHDHGGGPGQRADDLEWRAVMMEQLEGASEKARRCEDTIAELSAALAGERERVVQRVELVRHRPCRIERLVTSLGLLRHVPWSASARPFDHVALSSVELVPHRPGAIRKAGGGA